MKAVKSGESDNGVQVGTFQNCLDNYRQNHPEDDQALLEYLVGNHLIPGQTVTVKETAATRGVITLDCDGNEVVFSYDVAAKIRVYPAD